MIRYLCVFYISFAGGAAVSLSMGEITVCVNSVGGCLLIVVSVQTSLSLPDIVTQQIVCLACELSASERASLSSQPTSQREDSEGIITS